MSPTDAASAGHLAKLPESFASLRGKVLDKAPCLLGPRFIFVAGTILVLVGMVSRQWTRFLPRRKLRLQPFSQEPVFPAHFFEFLVGFLMAREGQLDLALTFQQTIFSVHSGSPEPWLPINAAFPGPN